MEREREREGEGRGRGRERGRERAVPPCYRQRDIWYCLRPTGDSQLWFYRVGGPVVRSFYVRDAVVERPAVISMAVTSTNGDGIRTDEGGNRSVAVGYTEW